MSTTSQTLAYEHRGKKISVELVPNPLTVRATHVSQSDGTLKAAVDFTKGLEFVYHSSARDVDIPLPGHGTAFARNLRAAYSSIPNGTHSPKTEITATVLYLPTNCGGLSLPRNHYCCYSITAEYEGARPVSAAITMSRYATEANMEPLGIKPTKPQPVTIKGQVHYRFCEPAAMPIEYSARHIAKTRDFLTRVLVMRLIDTARTVSNQAADIGLNKGLLEMLQNHSRTETLPIIVRAMSELAHIRKPEPDVLKYRPFEKVDLVKS